MRGEYQSHDHQHGHYKNYSCNDACNNHLQQCQFCGFRIVIAAPPNA